MNIYCKAGQEINPAYCHAEQQAADDLAILKEDPLLAALNKPGAFETNIQESFRGCDRLEKVIAGIRAELERRQTHQKGEQFLLPGE